MEFLLLAVLGLATLGAKEVLAPEEKEEKKDDKNGKGDKGDKSKDTKSKDDKADKEGDKEEPPKTPEQELMEAIAKYESQSHTGKKIKFHYEIEDK